MEELRIAVQILHIVAGVAWFGAGFYAVFVQLPAVGAMPPAARGPALAALAPRQLNYVFRAAELTIVSGFLRIFVSERGQQLSDPLGSRWAIAIFAGMILAFVLYGLVRGVVKPTAQRLLALGPQAAAGDASAVAQAPALAARLRTVGMAQVAIGIVIIGAMVLARFS